MSGIANARWVGLSQMGRIAMQLIGLSVLARLIPPHDYGIMAMATVVTNFALILRDVGTSAAIIQKKTLTEATINAVFWLNMAIGCVIAVLLVAFSWTIAAGFKTPALQPVLCVLALVFPITSSASVHLALLERDSVFKKVARIEISATLIALIVAIVAAYMGAGVYSLVFQAITNALLSSIQLWVSSRWYPTRPTSAQWGELKSLLGFSGNLSAFNLINYFSRNADSMVIGHFLSSSILGAYSLAYRLMLFPLQSLTFISSRALFPILSRHQDDHRAVWARYVRTIAIIAALVAPLMTGLCILRDPFVRVVFGPNWGLTAQLLLWLAPTGFIQSISSSTGTVFMAKGNTNMLMKLGILGAVLQVGSFLIGVQYGVQTMAALYLVANILNACPNLYCAARLLDGKISDIGRMLMPIIAADAVMAAVLTGALKWMAGWAGATDLIIVIVGTAIGVVVYGCALLLISRKVMVDLKDLLFKRGVA